MSSFDYTRRKSSIVQIGNTPLGGRYPIRIQSMANTSTLDTERSVEQCVRIVEAGAAYVRFTAQGVREAENLRNIRNELHSRGIHTPLVADIHFNPNAADAAATTVEKVRINPGNFVDSARTFKLIEYTDLAYAQELARLRERFCSFLAICREHGTAIRIGVNHGSLSDRIMSRYGDTPEGMVESCLEFLRICKEEQFHDVVISIKASNTVVMVQTVRLLVRAMEREGMNYPLHLGVTEAGDGEDGRIKSAVGIGALLCDGIGDTIRVSLSEPPEAEVPVAELLASYITSREGHPAIEATPHLPSLSPYRERRATKRVGNIGGGHTPAVVARGELEAPMPHGLPNPDYTLLPSTPIFTLDTWVELVASNEPIKWLQISNSELTPEWIAMFDSEPNVVLLLSSTHPNPVGEQRAFMHQLLHAGCTTPVVIHNSYNEEETESLQIKAGADYGALLLDGFADGILLENKAPMGTSEVCKYAFGILQAARLRTTKTEYISCPSCGRTLFDLEKTIALVKEATSHLKGLKIGIMGCIVNGPGEMADADFGYVGAGRGKVSLYRNKECVERNIPEEEAIEKLIALIKSEGMWVEREM